MEREQGQFQEIAFLVGSGWPLWQFPKLLIKAQTGPNLFLANVCLDRQLHRQLDSFVIFFFNRWIGFINHDLLRSQFPANGEVILYPLYVFPHIVTMPKSGSVVEH